MIRLLAAGAAAVLIGAPAHAWGAAQRPGPACFDAAQQVGPSARGIAACSRALDSRHLAPHDRAATLVNRGILKAREGSFAASIADYDAALAVDPGLAEAHINKGIALNALGGHAEAAIAALTAGLALHPANAAIAYYARGIADEMAGAVRDAYADYNQAARLAPDWDAPADELRRFAVVRAKKSMAA